MTKEQSEHEIKWFERRGTYFYVDENGDIVTRKDHEDFLSSNYYDIGSKMFIFNTSFIN